MVSVSLRVRVDSTVDRGAEKARQCLFVKEVAYASLAPEQKELLASAEEAMESAYNPYSGFSVGAALLTVDGKMIAGSNFENAAYSPGICAERAALVRANAEGHRMFRSIAVIARGADHDTEEVTAPCGVCRQMLYEAAQVSGVNIEIILSTSRKDKIVLTTIEELLPLAFGPKDIGIDVANWRKP